MKLFNFIEKNKIEENLRLNNQKEKNYIEVISGLNAELHQYKEAATKEFNKQKEEIVKLKNEIRKITGK